MSKGASEKVSMELAFLAALDSVHADVDTSEIAEIQDWPGAVRGKFYGASVKAPSRFSRLKASMLSALKRSRAAGSSSKSISGTVLGASGNMASHGSVQYSQMAIPQLIAVCTSESSEEAWSEFIRRFQPLIAGVIIKVAHRFRNFSSDLVHDLSQEVYFRLCNDNFRALRSVATHHENAFFGFLKVVATHTAQDHFRRAASSRMAAAQTLEVDHVFSAPASSHGASSEFEKKVLVEEIDAILKIRAHEPNFERDRTIFWLYFRQGLPAKEIAALPDIKLSVKGVESVLHRLTRQIKAALTQETKKPNRNL